VHAPGPIKTNIALLFVAKFHLDANGDQSPSLTQIAAYREVRTKSFVFFKEIFLPVPQEQITEASIRFFESSQPQRVDGPGLPSSRGEITLSYQEPESGGGFYFFFEQHFPIDKRAAELKIQQKTNLLLSI